MFAIIHSRFHAELHVQICVFPYIFSFALPLLLTAKPALAWVGVGPDAAFEVRTIQAAIDRIISRQSHDDFPDPLIVVASGTFSEALRIDAGRHRRLECHSHDLRRLRQRMPCSTGRRRNAWGGTTSGCQDVVVNLPGGFPDVAVRWRMGTDAFAGGTGYWLDDIHLGYRAPTGSSPTISSVPDRPATEALATARLIVHALPTRAA